MIRPVHIHYRRLPDRSHVYIQELILDASDVKVSFQPATPLDRPLEVEGRTILEPGSPVVWFTFPGRWHDIGRFHLRNGAFTGLYANVLTPPELHREGDTPVEWHTTDLFLDVWLGAGGDLRLLDEEEWARALEAGHLSPDTADRARTEAERIMAAARAGEWPPRVVTEWPLDRVAGILSPDGPPIRE